MKICPKCKNELNDNANYCEKCGKKIKHKKIEKNNNELNTILGVFDDIKDVLTNMFNIIKPAFLRIWNNKDDRTIIIICICLLILSMFSSFVGGKKGEKINWSEDIHLYKEIPALTGKRAEIYTNSDEYLSIKFYKITKDEYLAYKEECVNDGYNINTKSVDTSYYAFNKDGYDLSIQWYSSDKEMEISLSAPEPYEKLHWSTYELNELLPEPKSLRGLVIVNTEHNLKIKVSETSVNDYNKYIDKCSKEGFSLNLINQESEFSAQNKEGYTLLVEYLGYNAMIIEIKGPTTKGKISIDCIENIFLNKYDVELYINDQQLGSIEHGGSKTFEVDLKKGQNVLDVKNEEDSSIDGSIIFYDNESNIFKFETYCQTDQVKITEVKSINPPITNSEINNKSFEEVVKLFEQAGFDNVKTEKLANLSSSDIEKANYVSKITIGDNTTFTSNDKFFVDESVVIEYNSPREIEIGYSDEDFEDTSYDSVITKLENKGFINISRDVTSTSIEGNEGLVRNVSIDGYSSFNSDEKYPIDVEIIVDYYVYVPEADNNYDEDNDNDGKYEARTTFENYGEYCYPYGFKCHWFLGLIHEEQYIDGSWYFKVEVTIENAYGNKEKAIAEGVVSGDSVMSFYVG